MISSSFSDSNIAANLAWGRIKTTCLVKNVFGQQQYENVCALMRENKFSLCIDESTDVSTTNVLILVVRICTNNHVSVFFFDLLDVDAADAITLHRKIVNVFEKGQINYKNNLIGFAADRANNMTGVTHSVAALLKQDCKNLIISKCTYMSFFRIMCIIYMSETPIYR